jgi:PRTRC genetic system protein B
MERDSKPDFLPEKVLKVYKSGTDAYYIEIHPVYQRKGDYAIGAGQPLTKKTLQKLLGAAIAEEGDHIWWDNPIMPDCLLSFCVEKYKRHILWWRPKRSVDMLFAEKIGLKDGPVNIPAMLFFSHLDKIRIFALKENKRPTLRTNLYAAPLLNAIADNHLCWGNVSNNVHEIMEIDKEIDTWENYLWNSRFSHGGSAKVTKADIITVYKKIAGTKKQFPVSQLIPQSITVNDLIKEL